MKLYYSLQAELRYVTNPENRLFRTSLVDTLEEGNISCYLNLFRNRFESYDRKETKAQEFTWKLFGFVNIVNYCLFEEL